MLIHALNPSPWTGPTGNNTYLLTGRVPALIDAGVGHPEHLEAVAGALGGAALALVLVTHGHPDHVGGLPAIMARWPAARVVDAASVTSGTVDAGDTALRVIATPGHSPDHLCFLDEAAGDLYCGDLVRMGGTIVIPASRGGNLRLYLDSLRRIRDLGAKRLLPGHGPIVHDPAGLIDEYLHHRAEREAEVVGAVTAGYCTPEAIAGEIYRGLPAGLRAAAADSVLAHLIKLLEDGRAVESDGSWRIAPGSRPERAKS